MSWPLSRKWRTVIDADGTWRLCPKPGRRDWSAAGVKVGHVLRNGVAMAQTSAGEVARVALAAGRLSPEKGFDHAVRAARMAGLPIRVPDGQSGSCSPTRGVRHSCKAQPQRSAAVVPLHRVTSSSSSGFNPLRLYQPEGDGGRRTEDRPENQPSSGTNSAPLRPPVSAWTAFRRGGHRTAPSRRPRDHRA